MLPSHHIAATALAALPLIRRGWRPSQVAQFAVAAVLIDVDHYLSYAWRVRDPSLRRAYQFHRSRMGRQPHHAPVLVWDRSRPFHAPVLLVLLWAMAQRWPAFRGLAWGALFHRALDYGAHVAILAEAAHDAPALGGRPK